MRRPLVITAAAVLSGTLYGLTGIQVVWKLAATVLLLASVIGLFSKSRGRYMPLFFIVPVIIIFFAGAFLRSSYVSAFYDREENRAFFQKYEATNPGEFDYAMYLKAMGVSTEEERKALKTRNRELEDPITKILGDINEYCSAVLDEHMPASDSGIMKAMLLGNKNDMDDALSDLYRGSGISHLLAVSGLHVSLIGMGLFRLLRKKCGINLGVSAVISSAVIILYVIFTGASASSVRAGVMFLLSMIAMVAGRKTDLSSSLSFAGIWLLFKSPYLITQSGFLLSFGAIAGIILSVKVMKSKTNDRKERDGGFVSALREKAGNALISCICVTLATLPVIACSYYKAPLYSVFLNMAVIPLMSVVFLSGMTVLLFGIIGAALNGLTGAAGFFLWLSDASAAPGHYVLKIYEKLAVLTLRLPLAEVILGKPTDLKIIIYYVLFLLIVLILSKMKKRTFVMAILLLFYGSSFLILKVRETAAPYITVMDVGQGDSIHIHSGNTDILVDCGSSGYERAGSQIAEKYLLSKGIADIDIMVVSHADADHTNGLLYLLSENSPVRTKTIILPYLAVLDERYDALRDAAGEAEIKYAEEGMQLQGGGLKCVCIYSETDQTALGDTNRQSSVWLCCMEKFKMLLTGDITELEEAEICRKIKNEQETGKNGSLLNGITVLKCAHHGSKTATSEAFLEAVDPSAAVLSYGAGNRYGHPSADVVERLKEREIRVFSTAENGAVSFMVRETGTIAETCRAVK